MPTPWLHHCCLLAAALEGVLERVASLEPVADGDLVPEGVRDDRDREVPLLIVSARSGNT